jgi:RNA polymerase sigma-70 factor (ECF subfamily)
LNKSDNELVRKALAGNVAAFASLYERYYGLAVGLARCSLRDVHLAEDAAQEAFAVACRNLSKLREPDKFAQWLGTICRHTALQLAQRRLNLEANVEQNQIAKNLPSSDDRIDIDSALMQLDELSREVIVLHYYSELSHAEIAAALGLSSAAVHGRLQRARRKLAEYLSSFRSPS